MRRGGIGFVFVVLLVGAVLGTLLGEILGHVFASGSLNALFSRGASVGVSPFTIHLAALEITLGLMMRANLCTLIGVAVAFYLFRKSR
jgi:hypothetical protein